MPSTCVLFSGAAASVLHLTPDTFEEFVGREVGVLVEFYAPVRKRDGGDAEGWSDNGEADSIAPVLGSVLSGAATARSV
jgi:hypothetical protein